VGYTLVTERTFRTLTPADLDKLVGEPEPPDTHAILASRS
jgi:hypothetical protein